MAKKKKQHGGTRSGAGRKPLYVDPVDLSVRMPSDLHQRLRDLLGEGQSLNALIVEGLEAHVSRRRKRG